VTEKLSVSLCAAALAEIAIGSANRFNKWFDIAQNLQKVRDPLLHLPSYLYATQVAAVLVQ
jgi:hypothetical protein